MHMEEFVCLSPNGVQRSVITAIIFLTLNSPDKFNSQEKFTTEPHNFITLYSCHILQYCEKVMQTIIGQYRENRHISAIINEILFETKYRAIFRDVYCFSCREISPTPVRYFVAA